MDYLSVLPYELKCYLTQFLSLDDLEHLSQTNRENRKLHYDNNCFKQYLIMPLSEHCFEFRRQIAVEERYALLKKKMALSIIGRMRSNKQYIKIDTLCINGVRVTDICIKVGGEWITTLSYKNSDNELISHGIDYDFVLSLIIDILDADIPHSIIGGV